MKIPAWMYRGWAIALSTIALGYLLVGVNVSIQEKKAAIAGPPAATNEPPKDLMGWAGEEKAREAWEQLKGRFAQFKIIGAQEDNSRRRVVLWDAAKAVNGGKHLPTFRQAIGDCVGAGMKQAAQYLLCVQAVRDGGEYQEIYSPYHYACGRNAPECGNGRMGRDPSGSIGSWQADAVRLYGMLPANLPGLEPYSGSVVSRWAIRMPDSKWVQEGKIRLVKTVARLTTPEEVRDAICNGYPCTQASTWGGLMSPPVVDGKLVNRRADTWPHQMCFVGYDGTGKEPLWYCLNSWGPDAHGVPPDDAPPGGFWLRRVDIAFMCKDEVFSYSDSDGFVAQEWIILKGGGMPFPRPVIRRVGEVRDVEKN